MGEKMAHMEEGRFSLGCNYWASHAGTAMWSDWQPEVVERDLERLAEHGLQLLRVFPLWPDFQPIHQLYGGGGVEREIRFGEESLPHTAAGQAGLAEEMLCRFEAFADLADRFGMQLVVGLLTGWMSGRLFVPPALEGRNVLTDPVCLMWEVRFVREFIARLRDHDAIFAWDLGNECNCMGRVVNREEAWAWTASICNAIRAADPARPIVSGMHSLEPDTPGHWRIQDQGELTDLLTTHPYPYWSRHCRTDPVNTLRTTLHATAESRLYADIGGKPCFAEEIGSMGPMISSDEVAADFARTNLFSLWAHDCRSFMWCCASDQTELEHAPYDWGGVELELGLLRTDGSAKPVLREMADFRRFLEGLPFDQLPQRAVEGACILTRGQDHWGVAYAAFVLAKQAKFDLSFHFVDQPLPDAPFYLLPSLHGHDCIPRRRWLELLEKVRAGATLYMSLGDGIVSPFNGPVGVDIVTRAHRGEPFTVSLDGIDEGLTVTGDSGDDLRLEMRGATVLGREENGNPVFTRATFGEGCIYLLTFPVELQLTLTPGGFHGEGAEPFWKFYAAMAGDVLQERVLRIDEPQVGVTEHALEDGRRVAVLINYGADERSAVVEIIPGWEVEEVLHGMFLEGTVELPANDAVVLMLERG